MSTELDPRLDERFANFLRGDYGRDVLREVVGHTPPREIIVGSFSAGPGQEDTLAAFTDNVGGVSAGANVNAAEQFIGSSWLLLRFPKIVGYRRQVQLRLHFHYVHGGPITDTSLRVYLNHGLSSFYVPHAATRNFVAQPQNRWGTGLFQVKPNNSFVVNTDCYVMGAQSVINNVASTHVPDGWLDVEGDIPQAVDDVGSAWVAFIALVGTVVGGGAWRPVFRWMDVVGRYVKETS